MEIALSGFPFVKITQAALWKHSEHPSDHGSERSKNGWKTTVNRFLSIQAG